MVLGECFYEEGNTVKVIFSFFFYQSNSCILVPFHNSSLKILSIHVLQNIGVGVFGLKNRVLLYLGVLQEKWWKKLRIVGFFTIYLVNFLLSLFLFVNVSTILFLNASVG